MPTSLGRIEPTSTAPLDARLGPSADVLSELHVDLIREKRRSFLAALPLGVLAAAALVGASLYPRELGGLVFVALIVLAAVGRVGFEWLTLRRSDATALYRRERELEALRRDRQIEHEARLAEVAPIATSLLTATIVLVTGVEFARIAAVPVTEILVRGALIKPAVRAGEWWRLLTATYLHGNCTSRPTPRCS